MALAPVLDQQAEPLTFADLQRLPDDGNRYELLDGLLLVTPSPNTRHQTCVAHLLILLAGGADVGPQRLEKVPVLVVEVVSPSTRARDLTLKRAAYARAGVPACWVVDPDIPELRVFERGDEVARVRGDERFTAERAFPVTVGPADLLA